MSPLESCPRLQPILPELQSGHDYKICHYQENGNAMEFTLRLPFTSPEDVLRWLKKFEETSYSTWRTNKTYPNSGQKNVFRVDMHCHHNTFPRSSTADLKKGSKNTKCPSTMFVIVKRTAGSRGRNRSKDKHIREGYPTLITLKWDHNHEVASADALRERDVSDGTREKLLELYRSGHSPSSALDTMKYDLQEGCTDAEYTRLSADRARCPDLQYCYR
ncbi:uncharacterized protein [Apostichopus japonicus]|uniref:uncharacterized protein n=1 Tax=Stichopus japonicus TaxID=307972 RepID=UPI003AB2B8F0